MVQEKKSASVCEIKGKEKNKPGGTSIRTRIEEKKKRESDQGRKTCYYMDVTWRPSWSRTRIVCMIYTKRKKKASDQLASWLAGR